MGIILLGALFLPEARAAVDVWNVSTAYGHCYLVLPMALYLLWERRFWLRLQTPRTELGWAVLAIPLAAAWLGTERLGVMEGRQLTALAGVELLLLVVLGRRLFWAISGPLLFLFFLVPFGAFLTPSLQHFTAGFSVVGLQLLGIPHYADNFVIETPAGIFFVAEACAGLRFLIAAVAFGTFYALLNYVDWRRRLLFMLASIVVPILANGLRALGIVVLGQILGSAEAAAADHVIYGWVFFSAVMMLLVAAGHPFRQAARAPAPLPAPIADERWRWRAVQGAIACVLLLATGPVAAQLVNWADKPRPFAAAPLVVSPPGCSPAQRTGALGSNVQFSIACGDQHYAVSWTRYPARATAGAIVTDRRRVTEELGAEDVSSAPLDGIPPQAGEWTVVQTTDPDRVTAIAVWVRGHPAQGGLRARLSQARDSLFGSDYAPLMLSITTPEPPRSSSQARRAIIQELRAIVAAQGDLSQRVALLTQLASP